MNHCVEELHIEQDRKIQLIGKLGDAVREVILTTSNMALLTSSLHFIGARISF